MRSNQQPGDRRSCARSTFVTRVAVKTQKAIYFMECRNISSDGAYIESEIEIPLGTRCQVIPFVEDCGNVFEAGGKVVRTAHDGHRFGMGIQFDALADSDVQILGALIQEWKEGRQQPLKGTA